MKNRVISYLILMVMIFSVFIAVPTFAAYSDNVYLEYGFDNYTGGAPHCSGDKVSLDGLTNQSQTNKLYAGTEDSGNKYLYSDFDTYCGAYTPNKTSWSNVGFQVKFAEDFPTTGKYAISFDIGRGTLDTAKGSTVASLKMSNNAPRILAIEATNGQFHNYVKDNDANSFGENSHPFEKNVKYRVDVVFDLDNSTFAVYVDGQLLSSGREYTAGLAGKVVQWRLEHEIQYIDNVKVAKVTDNSFEATVTPGSGKVDIAFTESVQADIFENAYILNTVTGDEIEITGVKENLPKMSYTLLFDGEIMNGAEYVIQTEGDVENFCNTKLGKPLTFTQGTGKYVKSIKLVDYKGNEYYASTELVPETKIIKIYYTGMEASDEPGSSVEVSCESVPLGGSGVYDSAEQCLTYTLDEYLIGEKDYTLAINDALLSETYADVEFSTKEGSISIDKFTFTKTVVNEGVPTTEQVESLADLSHGDVIDLEIEIIKTTGEAKNMSLSYSAWASGFMKGFDFKDVSMTADKTYIKNKITSITISKDSTLTLDTVKGFLWTALGSNNPLAEEIVLD